MDDKVQAAREKPIISKVEIFDSLLTISFLTKALAKKIMLLDGDEKQGGKNVVSKSTLNLGSE